MDELLKNPLLGGMALVLLLAVGNWVTSVFTRRKQVVDLQMQLDKVRLEGQIAEAQRLEAARLAQDAMRHETAQAQKVIADALAQANKENAEGMVEQNRVLAGIALVGDKTHDLTNSAKTALDVVIADLRVKLSMAELALTTLKEAHMIQLQSVKDLAAKDVSMAREETARLSEQLKVALAQLVPPVRTVQAATLPAPEPPSSSAQHVTLPEQVLPVEGSSPRQP